MTKFRWGILATGHIASSMAAALQEVDDAELLAVASRSQVSAETFGTRWNIPRRYGSYDQLVADDDVEIVYVATPHSLHAQNMKLCLDAGKHVLCEKPLTINATESAECIAVARSNHRFLMEAVWMRFFPAIKQLKRMITEKVIGDVHLLQADFCLHVPFDPTHRLYDPELGGGALLDLGIYPLSLTTLLHGFPDEIHGIAEVGSTGIDELNALTLTYGNRLIAQLASSMRVAKPHEAIVLGNRGSIKVHHPFFHPNQLTLHLHDRSPETHTYPYVGNGYVHEVEEVHRCLRETRLESDLMPLDETQQMMEMMDGLRQQWGVVYPGDSKT